MLVSTIRDNDRRGILQIGDIRVAVECLEYESRHKEPSRLTVAIINDFEKSNSIARNNSNIEKVIFNDPATIVVWKDGTKTVVKCQPGDTYSKELGLAMCIAKKSLGNKGNFNEVFKKYLEER